MKPNRIAARALSLWDRFNPTEPDLLPYRRLAHQLHYRLSGDGLRSVLLVTPSASALCAHGALLLAACAAEERREPVLLIDASPREPEVSRILGSNGRAGFLDLLARPETALDSMVIHTDRENVHVLSIGAASVNGNSQEGLRKLLEAAESRYGLVLLSGGAVLSDPMALLLAPSVGLILLLAIENETKVDELNAAQDALNSKKPRQMGLVLTTPLAASRWSL